MSAQEEDKTGLVTSEQSFSYPKAASPTIEIMSVLFADVMDGGEREKLRTSE